MGNNAEKVKRAIDRWLPASPVGQGNGEAGYPYGPFLPGGDGPGSLRGDLIALNPAHQAMSCPIWSYRGRLSDASALGSIITVLFQDIFVEAHEVGDLVHERGFDFAH